MTVRVYVDWSGDAGFRFRKGSSDLLLVAAIMSDEEVSVQSLRKKLLLPENYEFHFSKMDAQIREKFCNYVNIEMEILGVVARVDKHLLLQEEFRNKMASKLLRNL